MQRILVLAHREELIFQALQHAKNAGLQAGIEMGALHVSDEEVVVSTVQTQVARSKCRSCRGHGCVECDGVGRIVRMTKFNPSEFGLVVIDEAHHATADSYRTVLEWYRQNPELKVLMVTATPRRADGIGLHNVCDSVAYEMDLRDAIDEGWLVPIRQKFVEVQGLDLSKVRTVKGDLAEGERERAFLGDCDEEEERLLHAIAKPTIEQAKGKPTLVFAAGVAHAEKLTAAFNAYDDVTAELVVGKTDRDERREIIERFKSGRTNVLVGCMVFTEGFDAPGTTVIANARPTKSESLYRQIIGRATRPLAGVVDGLDSAVERRDAIANSEKPCCTILDFVGNSGRHTLVSCFDVLAGDSVSPVDLEEALKVARREQKDVDVQEIIEKVKTAREEKQRRREERARKRQSTQHRAESARYTATDVSLFSGKKRIEAEMAEYLPKPGAPSKSQMNAMLCYGFKREQVEAMSLRQVSGIIGREKSKRGGEFIMTFGKHKGKRLMDIPQGYVNWMKENVSSPEVKGKIAEMEEDAQLAF